jgi:hypothetical protein
MADRLSELARQRALLSEHLAWLDREIADETVKRLVPTQPSIPSTPAPVSNAATPAAQPVTPAPVAPPTSFSAANVVLPSPTTDDGSEILDQYRVTSTSVKQDVRKGCLLYFAAAFVLLGLVVAILYFTIGTRPVD